MDHTTLSHLSDDELLRHLDNTRDPLTTTPAEIELAKRFDVLLGKANQLDELASDLEDSWFEIEDLRELLSILQTYSVDSTGVLAQKLKRANDWYALADEAGDLFSRLEALRATTL